MKINIIAMKIKNMKSILLKNNTMAEITLNLKVGTRVIVYC